MVDIYNSKLLELKDKTNELQKKSDLNSSSEVFLFIKKNKIYFLLTISVFTFLILYRPDFITSKTIVDNKVVISIDTSKFFIWWIILSILTSGTYHYSDRFVDIVDNLRRKD